MRNDKSSHVTNTDTGIRQHRKHKNKNKNNKFKNKIRKRNSNTKFKNKIQKQNSKNKSADARRTSICADPPDTRRAWCGNEVARTALQKQVCKG